MRRGALALVAALALALSGCDSGGAVDGPDRTAPSTPTDPAAHAKAEADRLLTLVRVPSEASPADHPPAKILNHPAESPATGDIVDLHRWWTIPWGAQKTLGWLTAHGVKHSTPGGSGTSGGPEGVTEYTLVFDQPASAGVHSEEVQLDIALMADGTSAIRADAQVVWLVDRAANETIPNTIDRIELSAYNRGHEIGHRALTGPDARKIARIINQLPTALRGVHSCAMDTGYILRVVAGSLRFDDDVACFDIAVTDGGKHLPALASSEQLEHAVTAAMGLPESPRG